MTRKKYILWLQIHSNYLLINGKLLLICLFILVKSRPCSTYLFSHFNLVNLWPQLNKNKGTHEYNMPTIALKQGNLLLKSVYDLINCKNKFLIRDHNIFSFTCHVWVSYILASKHFSGHR